jgi:MEMO1 family protein
MADNPIRQSVLAGQGWYPLEPDTVGRQINSFLELADADAECQGRLLALLVPHAGWFYSGQVAATAYAKLAQRRNQFDCVVLIGPSHREALSSASVFTGEAFATPLGNAMIDHQLADELCRNSDLFTSNISAHSQEHCLEIQIPFVQTMLPDVPIVPILVSGRDRKALEEAGNCLAEAIRDRRALIVISSDMTHFPNAEDARRIDLAALEAIKAMNLDSIVERIEQLEREPVDNLSCVMCGKPALIMGLAAVIAQGGNRAEIFTYANSGDVSGDTSRVVGYGAAGFFIESGEGKTSLSDAERESLLQIVRDSITSAVAGESFKPQVDPGSALYENLGAFVTLHNQGELRGCIGRFEPDESLALVVADMARSAALHDMRFKTVSQEELPLLDIEISVLSSLQKVDDPEDVEVGKHGVYITARGHRGTLLPQVASDRGWDRVTFLEQLCRKANLPTNAYLDEDAQLEVYTVDKFSGAFQV